MDITQIDFQQLRIKHILYKSKVRSFLYGGTFDSTFFSDAGPVDVWFSTVGMVRYAAEMELIALAALHQELNKYTKQLYQLYSSGKIDQAHDGLKEVERRSEQFLDLLGKLDKKIGVG
ncbi:histidine kinase [Pontibacter harenae]|uniref:histidine kinase n=1 Tax=Pontibacter harenae TaxID=2894083 RepID=UPI001E29FEC2|nr:histidine kinase [Pontibacter harenae]MCC9165737.1 histidine kinase [Pontibacter harenae]